MTKVVFYLFIYNIKVNDIFFISKKYPLLNKKGTVHVGLMRNYLQSPVTNMYSEMLDRR